MLSLPSCHWSGLVGRRPPQTVPLPMRSATQVSLHGGTACLCSGHTSPCWFPSQQRAACQKPSFAGDRHTLWITQPHGRFLCQLRMMVLPIASPGAQAWWCLWDKINGIDECLCVCVRDKEKVRGWLLLSELQSLDTLLRHCQSFQPRPLSDTKAEGSWVPKGKQLITPSWLSLYGFF